VFSLTKHIDEYFWWFGPKKYTIFFWSKIKKIIITLILFLVVWTKKIYYIFLVPNKKNNHHLNSFLFIFGPKKYSIFFLSKPSKKRINVMIIFLILDQKNIGYFFGPNHPKKE